MNLIGMTGKRGSGKTSAAQGLERLGWLHLNFADPVKEVVSRVYGVSYDELSDTVRKEVPLSRYPFLSPRELMQRVGTELFRDGISQTTWIEAFKRQAVLYPQVVCSDVRFPNEAAAIREMGGTIIRVTNPQVDRNDAASQHSSETKIDEIVADWVVVNDPRKNTIDQLRNSIIDIVGA